MNIDDTKMPANVGTSSQYGDEDDDVEFVKLIGAEGHEFIVPRRVALVSNTMRAMLEGSRNYTLSGYRGTYFGKSYTIFAL